MKKINKILTILFIFIIALNIASADISETNVMSISLVNQDPDPAVTGDIVELRIGLENLGGEAVTNLNVELIPEYPFELVEDAVQEVGTVSALQRGDDYRIIKYKVKVDRDAVAGSYDLDFTYYETGSPLRPKETINIDIKSKESAEVIHIDKSVLIPGEESPLKFTITNVGNAPLRDMTFSWENEDKVILPVGSDNTRYIKYLDVGEDIELEYKVISDSNADPGLYALDLSLKYDDPLTNEEQEISTIAGLYVGGETDFEVSFSESTAGETSFNIANIGSNPSYSVSVIVPKQTGWKTTGSNSEIIGNLDKGDYTVATFSIQSSSALITQDKTKETTDKIKERPSSEALKIEVAYTDTRGQRNVIEKEIELSPSMLSSTMAIGTKTGYKMTQEESFFSKYQWYIIIILLIAGAYYYFKIFKPKKKR